MQLMDAITFATKKHDGQRRKVDQLPYISHPYRVAMLLIQQGYPEHIVIAGLLHDVVEDTETTLDEIKEKFGEKVASLVDFASEPDKTLAWEDRKLHTIQAIKQAPIEAKLVVCADKIDNLTSILENEKKLGTQIWDSFKKGRDSQQWYYNNIYASLTENTNETDMPHLFMIYKQLLDKFNDIS